MPSTDTNGEASARRVPPPASRLATESVCFVSGTHISTTRGPIAVEALVVGDLAFTSSGVPRPIRWLGHREVDCRRHPRPDRVLPVRIAAHAFADDCPARDLFVSPGHAICVDVGGEILVPALALANGRSIARAVVDRVAYWHVELDSHDLLLAEDLPAESYLDTGSRDFFVESSVVALGDIAPDPHPVTRAASCRPFHADGPLVDAAWRRLALRAEGRAGPRRAAS